MSSPDRDLERDFAKSVEDRKQEIRRAIARSLIDQVNYDEKLNIDPHFLRFYRNSHNLTQRDLTEISGVPGRMIRNIESGKITTVGSITAISLATALEIDVTQLILQKSPD